MSSSDILARNVPDHKVSLFAKVSSGKPSIRSREVLAKPGEASWLRHPVWVAAAVLVWIALAVISLGVPDQPVGFGDAIYGRQTSIGFAVWALALALLAVASVFSSALRTRSLGWWPWLTVLGIFFISWELSTAKFVLLPVPFFAPPSALVEVYADDWPRLGDSLVNSLRLLAFGFGFGAAWGFVTGVSIGWSRSLGYWVHPILRFLGPIPSTALLPMAFFFFPTSFSAAVFLIALATWFPVTVLTWSGVAGVDKAYYDVARTLGADERFLIFKVAIPAALPHVFVGLFMGLGASFSVLVAAEMMGVKSGLGWYLQWAQGWAAYSNMYGALIVMAIIFSGLITLLFAVRDRLLAWQKGVVKW
ncbi:ABC transporter permease [Aliirhizobium smilacinae]|uniref:ABC transporter permease subunit n=1 Tax=Aliirhizobium smilacinae TaxID=1395944 RepID=A0A5C4XDU6_9HYPH|nr:ABC transporter permease subunit [Rhizobium smilacinae]TNM61656.1 ABC transporter permease subunit [Rhizobium smilacinae]